jgi:MerR family transcriptional regulator, mercuric resistance operon regulatory protein
VQGNVVIHETSARRYTIGVLSAETGCNVETIRYYERIGLLPPPGRSAGGQRAYRPADAARLRFVQRARSLGFPIEEVRKLIKLADNGPTANRDTLALTEAHLSGITNRLQELGQMAETLEALIARCPGGGSPECPILAALRASLTS